MRRRIAPFAGAMEALMMGSLQPLRSPKTVVFVGLGVSAFYEVSPPTAMMEKTIPNDRLKPQ